MGLEIDPQVLAALAPFAAAPEQEPPLVGDVTTRRQNARATYGQLAAARPLVDGVDVREHSVAAGDGATLALSWYYPRGQMQPGSAALYLHGGGTIFGLDDAGRWYDSAIRGYVAVSGVPMLMVDYRIAPEFPHPTPVEDCYAGLLWLESHADELEVDAARIAVIGDSAGGGLAAGVCLLSRDRGGPAVAQQLLIYPMLDDRSSPSDPEVAPFLTWTYDDNVTAWSALLGAATDVDPYAAPARATDLTGLPAAYIEVGDLDLFRNEDIAFAARLSDASVPTELHLHPGCPHFFDGFAPGADVTLRAMADRVRRLRSL